MSILGFNFDFCKRRKTHGLGRMRSKRVCVTDRANEAAAPKFLCFPENDFQVSSNGNAWVSRESGRLKGR
jgi:hypothetical protein